MKLTLKAATLICTAAFSIGSAGITAAEFKSEGSFVTQVAPKKYDRKIEAAAIEKAAEKIGDLRGSVSGDMIGKIISEADLSLNQSSRLGFPIILESSPENPDAIEAVPIV
ncbi:MAG: hypothetical protein WBC71_07360 [Salaquimonas sp.]